MPCWALRVLGGCWSHNRLFLWWWAPTQHGSSGGNNRYDTAEDNFFFSFFLFFFFLRKEASSCFRCKNEEKNLLKWVFVLGRIICIALLRNANVRQVGLGKRCNGYVIVLINTVSNKIS